jgi:hypothetical protein
MPKEAGSRFGGASPSSRSIDEYASSIIQRVQRRIRVSFSDMSKLEMGLNISNKGNEDLCEIEHRVMDIPLKD